MSLEQRNKLRREIADFRYSVVAELCNPYLSAEEKKRMIKEKVLRQYKIPGSKRKTISAETIRSWCIKYQKHGKDGLLPKLREDRGRPRSFSDAEAAELTKMLEEKPELTAAAVVKKLQDKRKIKTEISSSALSRFILANDLTRGRRDREIEKRRFEFEYAMECIQADAMHGFPIPDGKGKKKKAILLAFIDDATRRILYAKFDFSEKSLLFEDGIRHILKSHGRIGKLYVDNGSTFVSNQTKRITEILGVHITHSRPYKPQGRGKIERFFRTVRDGFLRPLEQDEIKSLEHLNHKFNTWLQTEYHCKKHSSLGVTPIDAWLAKSGRIKQLDPAIDIDETFLHLTNRKVQRDSIVTVKSIAFEVPPVLIGKTIDIYFDPHHQLDKIFIKYDGIDYGEAKPVDTYANAKITRGYMTNRELQIEDETNNQNYAGAIL